jgi:hypothetical protein
VRRAARSPTNGAFASAIAHARAAHRDWTDAGHDFALGQMPVAHQPLPAGAGFHGPTPRGVGILASFSAAAMPCNVVTPLACSALMVGARLVARARERAVPALRPNAPES